MNRAATSSGQWKAKACRAVLLLLCGLSAGNASAADWVKVVDSKASRIYVDTASISRIGDIVSVWYRREFTQPMVTGSGGHQQYRSSKVLGYYNCAEHEVASARWLTYASKDASGRPITDESAPSLAYGDVSGDESGKPVYDFVCRRTAPRKK